MIKTRLEIFPDTIIYGKNKQKLKQTNNLIPLILHKCLFYILCFAMHIGGWTEAALIDRAPKSYYSS